MNNVSSYLSKGIKNTKVSFIKNKKIPRYPMKTFLPRIQSSPAPGQTLKHFFHNHVSLCVCVCDIVFVSVMYNCICRLMCVMCVTCTSNVCRVPQPPQEHSCPSGNGNLPSLCRWCPVSTEKQHYTTTHTFIALRWIVNIALSIVQGMWYDGYLWQWRVPYHSCFQSEGQISHSSHRFPRSDKKNAAIIPKGFKIAFS